jgi:sugar lactone lactonase YvrE
MSAPDLKFAGTRGKILAALLLLGAVTAGLAQPPNRPLLSLNAERLNGYRAVTVAEAFQMPEGVGFSSVAAVAFNAAGHLIVLHRGTEPFIEFDAAGRFIRSFGAADLFARSHGLTIDADDNLWVTDVGAHVVMKLNPQGEILMTLGTRGEAGDWDESNHIRLFNQPNEVALDSHGNFYVAQGHGPGTPRVLKFSADGRFISQWGVRGEGAGEFAVAHSIDIDADDIVYVADRENFRVQRFDTDGNYLDEWKFPAMACAIYLHDDGTIFMTTGFDGELAQLGRDGRVLGSLGSPGEDNGQFGEAHDLAIDAAGNIYVADVVNRRVQKYRKD